MTTDVKHILRVDASMRIEGSVSRGLIDNALEALQARYPGASITVRDLAETVAHLDQAWINANFTDPDSRTAEQRQVLATSDLLVDEIRNADLLLIGVPMYNFGVPAALKAWIDQITRARETFQYTESGPVGLLSGKRAILVATSGGVESNASNDFALPYMRYVLGFIGITDVEVVTADQLMIREEQSLQHARNQINILSTAA